MGQCTHLRLDRLQIVSVGSLQDQSTMQIQYQKNIGQDFRITPYINYAYIHCLKKTKDRTILYFGDTRVEDVFFLHEGL